MKLDRIATAAHVPVLACCAFIGSVALSGCFMTPDDDCQQDPNCGDHSYSHVGTGQRGKTTGTGARGGTTGIAGSYGAAGRGGSSGSGGAGAIGGSGASTGTGGAIGGRGGSTGTGAIGGRGG